MASPSGQWLAATSTNNVENGSDSSAGSNVVDSASLSGEVAVMTEKNVDDCHSASQDDIDPNKTSSKRVCKTSGKVKEIEMQSLDENDNNNGEEDDDKDTKMLIKNNKHLFSLSSFQQIEKEHEVKRPRRNLDCTATNTASSSCTTSSLAIMKNHDGGKCSREDVKKSKNESSNTTATAASPTSLSVSKTVNAQNQSGTKRRIVKKSKNFSTTSNVIAVNTGKGRITFQQEETIQTKILLPPLNIHDDNNVKIQQQKEYLHLPVSTLFNRYVSSIISPPQSMMSSRSYDNDQAVIQKVPIDMHLASIPSILQSTNDLLSKPTCLLTNNTNSKNDDENKRNQKEKNCNSGTSSNNRILNVIQGEVGHATPTSCDVIVSDEATTCHIVAFWSRVRPKNIETGDSASANLPPPIASLAHVDQPGLYQECLRDIVRHHVELHDQFLQYYNCQCGDEKKDDDDINVHGQDNYSDDDDEEETEEEKKHNDAQQIQNNTSSQEVNRCQNNYPTSMIIDMDIHIMGGYNDKREKSIKMSTYLLGLFARLAEEFSSCTVTSGGRTNYKLCMTLRTCAVSQLNNERIVTISGGSNRPIGRGLGMNVSSGRVFLAKVDKSVAGPAVTLRSARIWSSCGRRRRTLSLIHDVERSRNKEVEKAEEGIITIIPFKFKPWEDMYHVLSLPDHQMIKVTSTSPDVEADDFCDHVRETLGFIRDNKWKDIFGHHCNRPIVYKRSGRGNKWQLITSSEEYSICNNNSSSSFGDFSNDGENENDDTPCCNVM